MNMNDIRGSQELEYYRKGYDYQQHILGRKLERRTLDTPEAMRTAVKNIAEEAAAHIRDQASDHSRAFDRGQLQAVSDWPRSAKGYAAYAQKRR
jgi:hypothetical protein